MKKLNKKEVECLKESQKIFFNKKQLTILK